MKDALSRRGSDTHVIDKGDSKYEIMQRFTETLASCKKVDTIIFFFSGHGIIDRGELFLIINGNGSDELSKIPVIEILGPFTRSDVKNKLIILDCCHAGEIRAKWINPEPSDVYRILVAANPL